MMKDLDFVKIGYWVATGIMCAIFIFSATMYFTKYEMVKGFFGQLGYPSYLVYPLAVAKILAVIAILSNKSKMLKEWAYAGFFFDAVLASAAHYVNGEGIGLSVLAVLAVVVSRYLDGRVQR